MVPQGIARSNDCYLNGVLKNKQTTSTCIDFNEYWALSEDMATAAIELAPFLDYDGDGTPDTSDATTDYYTMNQCGFGTQVCATIRPSRQPLLTHSYRRGRRMRAVRSQSMSPRALREGASKPATTRPAATLRTASTLTRMSSVPMAARGADVCLSKCRTRLAMASTWGPIGCMQTGTRTVRATESRS